MYCIIYYSLLCAVNKLWFLKSLASCQLSYLWHSVFCAIIFIQHCHLFLYISDRVVNICAGRFLYFVGFFYHISYSFVNLVSIDWLGLLLFWVVLNYFGLFQTLILDIFLINVSLSAIFTSSAWDKLTMVQTAGKKKSICDRWPEQSQFKFTWRFRN